MWMKLYLFDEDLEIQKVISKKDPLTILKQMLNMLELFFEKS